MANKLTKWLYRWANRFNGTVEFFLHYTKPQQTIEKPTPKVMSTAYPDGKIIHHGKN